MAEKQALPRVPGLSAYQEWLRGSRTFVRWHAGWASIMTIGMPMAGGWALTHVVVGLLGLGELGLPIWVLVWALLAPPLYFAATVPLRLIAGWVDERAMSADPGQPRSG